MSIPAKNKWLFNLLLKGRRDAMGWMGESKGRTNLERPVSREAF